MSAPGQLLVLPLVGPTDPRFLRLRREIERAGRRLCEVTRPLHYADMRPLFRASPGLRLLP